jgi:rubrerythrin
MEMEGSRGSATASTSEILEGLNDLLQLDHDAIGAYEIAIEKLEDRDHANQISGFKLDHERHIRELNDLILELGGTPANEPHATAPLKQAMQKAGALGGDRGTLIAWRANELQVRTKYDSYASRANAWPSNVKRVVDEAALDEERHYHWVANALQQMGVGAGEGLETELLNKLREKGNQVAHAAGNLTDRAANVAGDLSDRVSHAASDFSAEARERAGAAAETARHRAADGLERAAHRLEGMVDEPGTDSQGRLAGAAHTVAGGMESTAGFLRSPDPVRLRENAEDTVRTNPGRTLLTTFAVGFIVGRLLR